MRGHRAFEACVEQLGDRDPAGCLPARHHAPGRARPGGPPAGLPGDPARRRWPPCERPDWSRPARGRGGGTVVTPASRGTPVGQCGSRPDLPERRPTGSTRWSSGGSSSPGAAYLAACARAARRRPARARAGRAHDGRRGRAGRRRTGRPTRASTSRSPSPRRLAADRRGGDLGAGDAARDAAGDPGARHQHRALGPPARRAGARRSWPATPSGRDRSLEEHCDDTAACCAASARTLGARG